MDEKLKENVTLPSTWIRGAYMLLFVIIFNVVELLLTAVILVQFGFMLVTADTNENLQRFGRSLGIYAYQIIKFLTYVTDDMPYPFGQWPSDADDLS